MGTAPANALVPVLLALAAPGAAAQTFVVDANNGPGTSFTTIVAAVAAVPDGAVLQVRAGHYASFAIHAKSLAVLAEPGVTFGETYTGSIAIANLAASQRVVVRGLRSALGNTNGLAVVQCSNCSGPVLIEEVRLGLGGSLRLEVTNCAQVHVVGCWFTGTGNPFGGSSTSSALTIVSSIFVGGVAPSALAGSGFVQNGGSVQMTDVTANGGFGGLTPSGNGVAMNGGTLRLSGTSSLIANTLPSPLGGLAIAGTGVVRLDPAVQLVGVAPVIAPTIAATAVAMPSVRSMASGALGSSASASMTGPASDAGVLLLGTTAPPLAIPGWDPLEIDNGVVMALGMLTTPVTATVLVPSVPALVGSPFGWQGVTIDPAGSIAVGNAAWFVLH